MAIGGALPAGWVVDDRRSGGALLAG